MSEKSKKDKLIENFEKVDTASIVEICRRAGASREVFYYHFERDPAFRKRFLEAKRESLSKKIAAAA